MSVEFFWPLLYVQFSLFSLTPSHNLRTHVFLLQPNVEYRGISDSFAKRAGNFARRISAVTATLALWHFHENFWEISVWSLDNGIFWSVWSRIYRINVHQQFKRGNLLPEAGATHASSSCVQHIARAASGNQVAQRFANFCFRDLQIGKTSENSSLCPAKLCKKLACPHSRSCTQIWQFNCISWPERCCSCSCCNDSFKHGNNLKNHALKHTYSHADKHIVKAPTQPDLVVQLT